MGRRAVQRYPEGNFPSRWRVPGSCATRRPSKRGYGVFGVREGRGIRLCRTRYRLNRGVRIPGNHPRLERGRTRVVPSTVLRRRRRSATANGACFGMLSPPRLRGRCRPSPVTGRGTVRTANESEPRTPHRFAGGGRGTVRFSGKRPRVFRLRVYAIGLPHDTTPGYLIMSVVEGVSDSSPR